MLAAPLSVLQSNGIGAMKALTPAALTPRGGSLRLLRFAFPPFRSQPRAPSEGRFRSRLSALGHSRLRHHPAGSPRLHAESDSCSYRLAVRLRLLPTPARADAVTFGYMVTTLHDGDSHPADKASSQTHWMPGTRPGMTPSPVMTEWAVENPGLNRAYRRLSHKRRDTLRPTPPP